jgi:hypothetical protein
MIWPRVSSVLLLLVLAAHAEELPREFTITPTSIKEQPAFLTPVVVPDANCAAVSDATSILVVGHKTKDEKHLAVFRLDAKGLPSGEPKWITLPKPASLAANFNYPLGLLFHPRLPLLYVWQDVNGPPPAKQENNPEFKDYLEFDHLVIYAIKDGALELLHTGAHGTGFHCGLNGGTIGLDFTAKNLFVPNAIGSAPDEGGIGFYALDDEGLPMEMAEDTPAKPKAKGLAVKVNTAKDINGKATKIVLMPKRHRTHRFYPTGEGWFAGSEAIVMGGYSGCMVSDFHNGSLRNSWFNLPELAGHCYVAGHPTLPAVYFCLQDNNHLYQIAHSDGYVSLLPQVATVTAAHLTGAPVVLTKLSRLAVGDTKSLHLFGLQADGKLDGKDEHLTLPCAFVRGLTWSEKHGRLYVAVDKGE